LLEAMPMTGGASLGATATNVAGSQMQKNAGVEDSPELILASYAKDLDDPYVLATAKMYSENNGATYDWLASDIGVKFADEVQFFPPYPVARICYPIGGGPGIAKTLTEKVESSSVELLLETTATELIKEEGAIAGVIAQAASGTEYQIATKAVILAAGGFGAKRGMLPYEPLKNVIFYGSESSDGKAMGLALYSGAMLRYLDNVSIEGGGLELTPGTGTQLYSVVLGSFRDAAAIIIGPDGNRVMNEMGPAPLQVKAYESLPDSTAYLFLDKASFDVFYGLGTREVGGVFSPETWEKWLASEDLPVIVTADTVDDVASQAGISSEGLKATIESFNADAPTGTDSVFNRPIAAAIGEGPYYIIKMNLRYAHSYGGLIANENLEVLDWAEKPIAGLYGAGQMLCSIQGRNNIAKPSTGTSFAYTSGRRAVLNALEAV
ncbi:MAG: FAD-binding protein, partial [Raoultibacter sp.]